MSHACRMLNECLGIAKAYCDCAEFKSIYKFYAGCFSAFNFE